MFFSLLGKCCLHAGDDDTAETFITFNNSTLEKCSQVLLLRKEANLKYNNFTLPLQANANHGYHHSCYRKFTALPPTQRDKLRALSCTSDPFASSAQLTRSNVTAPIPVSSSGVFSKLCIFCSQKEIKFKYMRQKLVPITSKDLQASVKEYAELLDDDEMRVRIATVTDFAAKEVHYHRICRVNYQNRAL